MCLELGRHPSSLAPLSRASVSKEILGSVDHLSISAEFSGVYPQFAPQCSGPATSVSSVNQERVWAPVRLGCSCSNRSSYRADDCPATCLLPMDFFSPLNGDKFTARGRRLKMELQTKKEQEARSLAIQSKNKTQATSKSKPPSRNKQKQSEKRNNQNSRPNYQKEGKLKTNY